MMRGSGLVTWLVSGSTLWATIAWPGQDDWPGADLFTNGIIHRLRIDLPPAAAASLRSNPRKFVAATVSEGATVYPQVGVRLKGSVGSFRPLDDKPSLTLDFSEFSDGQKFHGLRRIYLNNSLEDPSYVNEKIGSELFQAAGVPAPRVTRALVVLTGRVLGPYVLKEGFTEDFLSFHFKRVGGDLYESEDDAHDVNERLKRNSVRAPVKNRAALKALAAAALEPNPTERWRRLERTLDTERFITFMAMEVMLGHRDGYCMARNNFRVYHDLDTDKMIFFPHGMDQLFGTADLPWRPHLAGVVARGLMGTTEGSQAYAATFTSLLTNVFEVEQITHRIEQLVQELRPVMSRTEFAKVKAEAESAKHRVAKRKASLIAQLNQPVLKAIEFVAGVAHPDDWKIGEPPPRGRMDRTNVDSVAALHISTSSEAAASWRTTVLVPRGRYRFEGRARISGVEPLPFGIHQGAGLRIGGSMRDATAITGDAAWQSLSATFEVAQPMKVVELICELRARAGEAWFDLDSLRLLRIE